MRTTYGSPLFADHMPGRRLAARRAAARGGRGRSSARRTRRSSARARRRSTRSSARRATRTTSRRTPRRVQRRRGGRGRGGDDAVRRRVRPRRERPQPGGVLQPRRPAALARPDPGPRAGRPVEPAAGARHDRAHAADVALLFSVLAGPDPRDPLSIPEPWPIPDLDVRPAGGCGSPGAATSAACPSSPR